MRGNLSLLALAASLAITPLSQAAAQTSQQKAQNASDYIEFGDLTGVEKFKASGLRYTFNPTSGGYVLVAAEPFGDGVKAEYDADTGNVTFKTPDGLKVTFTAADEVPGQSTPNARLFNKPNPAGGVLGGSLSTPHVNAVPLSYTRFGTVFSTGAAPLDGHAFVFGVNTLPRDLPKSGSATYTAAAGGSATLAGSLTPLRLTGSSATFSADFGTGAIATTIKLVGTPAAGGASVALDDLTGLGSISAAKPGFSGLFTGTGTVSGTFNGAFFGPEAVEFGYSFLVGGTSAAGKAFTAIGGAFGSTAIPPPPPPPVYTAFQDLTGVQNFASAGVRYSFAPVPSGGTGFTFRQVEALGSGVAVQYDTANGDVTYTAPDGTSTTFTAANVVATQSTATSRVFNKSNPAGGVYGGSLSTPTVGGVALTYTRLGTFFTNGTPAGLDGHTFVFGVQTLASDVPTTGTASYTGQAGGTAALATGGAPVRVGGTSTLTADFATGAITTAFSLAYSTAGVTTALDILSGTGSIGANKPGFAGTLIGSGNVTGNFTGAFFGPQATEFGYDYIIGGTTAVGVGFTSVGAAFGKKD